MNKKQHHADTLSKPAATPARKGKIHPVLIYPYPQPTDYVDLMALDELVARLDAQKDRYARPITVMERKTARAQEGNPQFARFRKEAMARHSDILDAWCVDTCQMWYTGLGAAFDQGEPEDIYWLIPGDFNYGSSFGREVLGRLQDLPEIIDELDQDLCIGEITTDHSDSKQLIDTYGTFALLYHWFPAEARQIREYTERPRSEFFAIRHAFLKEVLAQRWFAYEQTVVMLLLAVAGQKKISRFSVGDITDLPHGGDSLHSAIQQVERTERVLKMFWRERHQQNPGWIDQYLALEAQSDRVRGAAIGLLRQVLQ